MHMLDQFRQSQCSNPTIGYAALAPLLIVADHFGVEILLSADTQSRLSISAMGCMLTFEMSAIGLSG
jgi:hypothetical protein